MLTIVQMLAFIKQLITSDDESNGSSSTSSSGITVIRNISGGCSSSSSSNGDGRSFPPSSTSPVSPGVLVITLHQPGRELTALLDDLLLLAPGGRAVYAGTWAAALPYFEHHLQLTPPPHTGLAEWYLSLLTSQSLDGSGSGSISSSSSLNEMCSLRYIQSKDSTCPLNLQQAWLAYSAEQQALCSAVTHSSNLTSAGQQSTKKQQDEPRVIRVVIGRDTAHEHVADVQQQGKGGAAATASAEPQQGTAVDCSGGRQVGAMASRLARSDGKLAGFWVQVHMLALRSLRYWWRNPAMVMSGEAAACQRGLACRVCPWQRAETQATSSFFKQIRTAPCVVSVTLSSCFEAWATDALHISRYQLQVGLCNNIICEIKGFEVKLCVSHQRTSMQPYHVAHRLDHKLMLVTLPDSVLLPEC